MESSSESGPTIDERLETLEHAMDRLKLQADNQDHRVQESKVAGEQLKELIKKFRADLSASLEKMEEFEEEVRTDFKDTTNIHGDLGKRVNDLEQAVSTILAKLDK